MLPVAVARSSGRVVMRYVLPRVADDVIFARNRQTKAAKVGRLLAVDH